MAKGKYTLVDGWIYLRGQENDEEALCIEASDSDAVRKWAEREAREGYVIGDENYYYTEDDLYEAEKEIIAEVTDGDLDEMDADLDKEFERTPSHHRTGMAAVVEVSLPGYGAATEKVPCLIVGRTSAMDRPYRLDVRLADGRTLGECAPECVTPPTAQI